MTARWWIDGKWVRGWEEITHNCLRVDNIIGRLVEDGWRYGIRGERVRWCVKRRTLPTARTETESVSVD